MVETDTTAEPANEYVVMKLMRPGDDTDTLVFLCLNGCVVFGRGHLIDIELAQFAYTNTCVVEHVQNSQLLQIVKLERVESGAHSLEFIVSHTDTRLLRVFWTFDEEWVHRGFLNRIQIAKEIFEDTTGIGYCRRVILGGQESMKFHDVRVLHVLRVHISEIHQPAQVAFVYVRCSRASDDFPIKVIVNCLLYDHCSFDD